jgi:hypothetical protein
LSARTVLLRGEIADEWTTHREAVLRDLAPSNAVASALAEPRRRGPRAGGRRGVDGARRGAFGHLGGRAIRGCVVAELLTIPEAAGRLSVEAD